MSGSRPEFDSRSYSERGMKNTSHDDYFTTVSKFEGYFVRI